MNRPSHELILHHYDASPFAEKVRLVLGLKGLAWRSVIVPMVLPKPDLMPLTGGNRRTPVLQIGADVYCGTSLIAGELERRFPEPTVYPGGRRGLAEILSLWADQLLFAPSSSYAIRDPAHFPPAFHRDRAAMRGHVPADPVRLAAEAPHHLEQLQLQLGHVEQALAHGQAYLLGEDPSIADFAAYARLWWAQLFGGDRGELASLPRVRAWRDRIAAIGHGERRELTPGQALERAKAADPDLSGPPAVPATVRPGDRIAMATKGHGPDPVAGEVVAVTPDAVALRREDPLVGAIAVHLPREGYTARPLAPASRTSPSSS